MKGLQLILTESDFSLLMDYYSVNTTLSAYNHNKLFTELRDARIVRKEYLPLNVVSLNSKVLIWNMSRKQMFTVHIVSPEELDGKDNRITIYDPIAVALLGYPSGAVTEWEMEDGINRLKVLSVTQLDAESTFQV